MRVCVCVYLYIALLIDEQVLRLKISVNEVERVKVFKRQDYLRGVKASVRLTTKRKRRRKEKKQEQGFKHHYILEGILPRLI